MYVKAVISLSVEVKNINVGTLLMLLFFYYSDGVLCFLTFFIVILLQFFAAHVRMYAYTHIRIAK